MFYVHVLRAEVQGAEFGGGQGLAPGPTNERSESRESAVFDATYYRAQAALCSRIAESLSDKAAAERTRSMAEDYLRRAAELEHFDDEQPVTKN